MKTRKEKDLTEKLSYENLSEKIQNLPEIHKNDKVDKLYDGKSEFSKKLIQLRKSAIQNHNNYSSPEKQDIMNQFKLIDGYINDYIRVKL
jgi:hypothetical protein